MREKYSINEEKTNFVAEKLSRDVQVTVLIKHLSNYGRRKLRWRRVSRIVKEII